MYFLLSCSLLLKNYSTIQDDTIFKNHFSNFWFNFLVMFFFFCNSCIWCLIPERDSLSKQFEQHSGLKQNVFKDSAVMFKGIYGRFCMCLLKPVIKMYSSCKTLYLPWASMHMFKRPASCSKKCSVDTHVMFSRYILVKKMLVNMCAQMLACIWGCKYSLTCIPRSCLRSIGVGWGSHRSAQCMEANLCHCTGDPSTPRHQCVKFKLLLQPGNSIIWGKDMSLWRILAVFFV